MMWCREKSTLNSSSGVEQCREALRDVLSEMTAAVRSVIYVLLIFHPAHSFYLHFSIKMHACMSNEMKSIIVQDLTMYECSCIVCKSMAEH